VSAQRRRVTILLGLVALNAAVFGVFTLPRSLQRRNIESRAETLRSEVGRGRTQLAALKQRDDIIRENRRDVERLYGSILKTPDESMIPAIRFVEKAAAEEGLTAGAHAWTRDNVKGLGLWRLGMTMPLSGPYPQIVGFLRRLERAPLFLVVDDVQLRVRSDVGGDLAFHLSAYFKDDSKSTDGT
jgi:Tfp pilus assembly protein PilO